LVVSLITGNANPGYCGELSFGIKNLSNNDFVLELGARVVQALFYNTSENVSSYRGQWQGGRVSTGDGEEVQV